MKNFAKLLAGIALLGCAIASPSAFADVSFNIGWASEYYYRGILQKESSASAGVDYEEGGVYVGAWTADVGDGLEVDGYFGYGIETEEGFSASLGVIGYYYTGDFDETYEEVNLNLGYGMASLEYSAGTYDDPGGDQDYDFTGITIENAGFYGTYGNFGGDFSGDYLEVGYGTAISGIDVGIAAIFSDADLSDQAGDSQALVLTIGYSW